jgi:hypothetical protein
LNQTVLAERQAQLSPDHVDVFESLVNKIRITCGQDRIQEATDLAFAVTRRALDTFGQSHPVTIRVEAERATTESALRRWKKAAKIREVVMKAHVYQVSEERSESDDGLDDDFLYRGARFVLDHCQAQRFKAAATFATLPPYYMLGVAKPEEFTRPSIRSPAWQNGWTRPRSTKLRSTS